MTITTVTRRFAENTQVKPSQTLAEIEHLLTRYGYPPKAFELDKGDSGSMWVLRVMCDSFTLRFKAVYKSNPRARLTDYQCRIRAGNRLMRVALLVLKGKFEEIAGQGEIGIDVQSIAVNLPGNFELEDGDTLADKMVKSKWMKQLTTSKPRRKVAAIAPR